SPRIPVNHRSVPGRVPRPLPRSRPRRAVAGRAGSTVRIREGRTSLEDVRLPGRDDTGRWPPPATPAGTPGGPYERPSEVRSVPNGARWTGLPKRGPAHRTTRSGADSMVET